MKRWIALLGLLTACGGAPGEVRIEDAWIAPPPAGSGPAGGFLTLHNGSDRTRSLQGASSPAAARIEIHRSWFEKGIARMARLDALDIPAGQELRLEPGAHHLMLFGVSGLAPGETLRLHLTFDGGEAHEVEAVVRSAGQADPHQHH